MTSDDTDDVFAKCLPELDIDLEGDQITKLDLSGV